MDLGALGDTVSLARKSKLNKSLAKPSTTLPSSTNLTSTVKSKIGSKGIINPSNTNKFMNTSSGNSSSSSSNTNVMVSNLSLYLYTILYILSILYIMA